MNYQVQFKNGKVEYIDQKKYLEILDGSGNPANDTFIIRNNHYQFKDIKRMREPKEDAAGFDVSKWVKNKTPERRKKALEQMAKGLKGYMESDRYQGTDKPQQLLNLMRQRYAEANN